MKWRAIYDTAELNRLMDRGIISRANIQGKRCWYIVDFEGSHGQIMTGNFERYSHAVNYLESLTDGI